MMFRNKYVVSRGDLRRYISMQGDGKRCGCDRGSQGHQDSRRKTKEKDKDKNKTKAKGDVITANKLHRFLKDPNLYSVQRSSLNNLQNINYI